MVVYKLITQNMFTVELGAYITYGIQAYENNKSLDVIEDVSVNKDNVQSLVNKFNEGKLEICHLREAIDDYLYDLSAD